MDWDVAWHWRIVRSDEVWCSVAIDSRRERIGSEWRVAWAWAVQESYLSARISRTRRWPVDLRVSIGV